MISSAKRRSYSRRRKMSVCRGIPSYRKCIIKRGCKYASGTQRRFCRKQKNTPHHIHLTKTKSQSQKHVNLRRSRRLQQKLARQ